MRYTPYRGLAAVTNWVKLKFATMNLKKLAIHKEIDRKRIEGALIFSQCLLIFNNFLNKNNKLGIRFHEFRVFLQSESRIQYSALFLLPKLKKFQTKTAKNCLKNLAESE